MIQANEISLGFGDQQIFSEISFNINSGERIGLVGRNGSGKTTLFRMLTGEVHPDSGRIITPKNYTIGYLKQHLDFKEPNILMEACLGLPDDEKDAVWKAEKILMGLGFTEAEFEEPPSRFSGGFQVRLNLAKVLLSEPHLLLLDEPTNYLDIVSIRWLTGFLKERRNELVIITHDRDFMNAVTTHTMAIHRSKMKKVKGDTYKIFEQIEAEEETYEKERARDEKVRKETQEFINRFRSQAAHAKLVQSRMKTLEKMDEKEALGRIQDMGFHFNYKEFHAKTHVRIDNISFGYVPERKLIENLDMHIHKDDRICIIGKNGKGKSTLLRLLAGELEPDTGEIKKHEKTAIGYFGQTNIERLSTNSTIVEELERIRPDLLHTQVRAVCGAMMFSGDLALKEISVLSGGEKSRVSLAKILLQPANLLLLDEPTNHLDIQSCDSMISALEEFSGAVIIVTHSEMFLHRLANRLIVFDEDKVAVFEGSYQDFLDRVGWQEERNKPKSKKQVKSEKTGKEDFNFAKNRRRITDKIAKTEKIVDKNEKLLEEANHKLAEAYGNPDSDLINELQEKVKKYQGVIDKGFADLERLVAELDEMDKN